MLTPSGQAINGRFPIGFVRRFSHTATRFRQLRWPLTTLLLPPATLAECGMGNSECGINTDRIHSQFRIPHSAFRIRATRHYSEPRAVRSIRGEPSRSANRQAFPSSPYQAILHGLLDRQIERISFRVSTNTHRAPLRGLSDARAFTSYRIGKEHPHDPDILSLRHDCPTLAGVSGKWSLLDGRSAMATGWFPSLSDGVRGPSHPPGGCSVTRPPSCCVTRPRAWSRTSIQNRFASLLAGG